MKTRQDKKNQSGFSFGTFEARSYYPNKLSYSEDKKQNSDEDFQEEERVK